MSEPPFPSGQAVKDRYPEIPWTAIAGFRNRLVHGYTEVKAELVWEVIAQYLAPLHEVARDELLRLRRELDRDKGSD